MALPPTIPTSFVPRSEAPLRASRERFDFSGAFLFVASAIFFLALALALGVFLYGRYLAGVQKTKDAALATAEAQVDQNTITSLLTLQEQLTQGKTLLDQHIALSQFFDVLQTLTPSSVSYSSLSITVADDNSAQVALTGTAASFNALAALSADLATNIDIKDAIFSNLAIGASGVGFSLSATLDPTLVEMPASGIVAPSTPIAPTAASTTAPQSTP